MIKIGFEIWACSIAFIIIYIKDNEIEDRAWEQATLKAGSSEDDFK